MSRGINESLRTIQGGVRTLLAVRQAKADKLSAEATARRQQQEDEIAAQDRAREAMRTFGVLTADGRVRPLTPQEAAALEGGAIDGGKIVPLSSLEAFAPEQAKSTLTPASANAAMSVSEKFQYPERPNVGQPGGPAGPPAPGAPPMLPASPVSPNDALSAFSSGTFPPGIAPKPPVPKAGPSPLTTADSNAIAREVDKRFEGMRNPITNELMHYGDTTGAQQAQAIKTAAEKILVQRRQAGTVIGVQEAVDIAFQQAASAAPTPPSPGIRRFDAAGNPVP
jgi:hypothetical protein